jgi:hypothetical protein
MTEQLAGAHDVVAYLLAHKFLTPQDILAIGLSVVDLSHRNKTFKVLTSRGAHYIVKQSVDSQMKRTIANEAKIYRLLASLTRTVSKGAIPKLLAYNSTAGVLILEAAANGESLAAYNTKNGPFSVRLAKSLGKTIATVHRIARESGTPSDGNLLYHRPWVFSVCPTPPYSFLSEASNAMLELVRIIQQYPHFCNLLDQLSRSWRPNSLVHGDLKWDNCVAASTSVFGRKTRIIIVEWEFSGIGDPWWDVGAILSEYLRFWLGSGPISDQMPLRLFEELAMYPLAKLRPAIRSFWTAYCQTLGLDDREIRFWTRHAVKYAAAMLVQRVFEQMQYLVQPTGMSVVSLQLAFNMLQQPKKAATDLLGIEG